MAMHSTVILGQEVKELRVANERQKRKKQHRRRYIAQGGVLQAEQGQFLIQARENREQGVGQNEEAVVRQRALKKCSNCRIQGHTIHTCLNIQRIS
jgi:hypothetical protein